MYYILIVIKEDGSYQSTPFYVKFKKAVPGEKVDLVVNAKMTEGLNLMLDAKRTIAFSEMDGADTPQFMSKERLQAMELNEGDNWFEFKTCQTNLAKLVRVLVWRHNVKIVITDIDGTITRSNVRGHLMPRLGFDWSHSQVSKFFQKLYNIGYKIIYVTARSIKMNTVTREYLSSLDLPPGPIFSALKSIGRSVVSELFTGDSKFSKVAHLQDIMKLFPDSFVAGFGNNEKDFWTYTQVKIPSSHLFIINKKGHIKASAARTSYKDLLNDVEQWFPEICIGVGDSQPGVSDVISPPSYRK